MTKLKRCPSQQHHLQTSSQCHHLWRCHSWTSSQLRHSWTSIYDTNVIHRMMEWVRHDFSMSNQLGFLQISALLPSPYPLLLFLLLLGDLDTTCWHPMAWHDTVSFWPRTHTALAWNNISNLAIMMFEENILLLSWASRRWWVGWLVECRADIIASPQQFLGPSKFEQWCYRWG